MTRLQGICDMTPTPFIADVGTDHGFVPKTLIESKKIIHAFVTDISEKCLDKAKGNLIGLESSVTFLCGNGLSVFDEDMLSSFRPITAIITGMGGIEIMKILSHSPVKFDYYLLGAQRNIFELKDYLFENNYEILQDKIVKEDKMFYNLLLVKHSDTLMDVTRSELYFGKDNLKTLPEDFLEYVKFLHLRYNKLLNFRKDDIMDKYLMLQDILGGKNV